MLKWGKDSLCDGITLQKGVSTNKVDVGGYQ